MLTESYNILIDEFQKGLSGDPEASRISYYSSNYPEADGGRTSIEWNNNELDESQDGRIALILPRLESINDIEKISTHFHEQYHASEAIKRFRQNGNYRFESKEQSTKEEYRAQFFGDVIAMSIAIGNNSIVDPAFKERVNVDLLNYGKFFPFVAYYLGTNGVMGDSGLYELMYDTDFWYFFKNSRIDGVDYYTDQEESLRQKWESYPWTPQEIDLVRNMIERGVAEGWIMPDAYPQLPDLNTNNTTNNFVYETPDLRPKLSVPDGEGGFAETVYEFTDPETVQQPNDDELPIPVEPDSVFAKRDTSINTI